MERLDFASVMQVLRRNVLAEKSVNQVDFLYELFLDAMEASPVQIVYDGAQASRWLNGLLRLNSDLITFYLDDVNQRKLERRIERWLLPMMPDSAMAIQELYDLVIQASNVSPEKKMELTNHCSVGSDRAKAVFVAKTLCFAMQLRFEKRDVRKEQLIMPGNLSPAVVDYIFDTEIPKPCRWFLGRKNELARIHTLLMENSKVFLHGIPGIGKSELAKVYAKRHMKEFTNVIYINYPGDLKRAVIELDFADDRPDETDEMRFKRHNRFLRSLREDTLLLVDNFNATTSQDPFLDVMLKYRCRILFTTRCRYENQACMELRELDEATLSDLVSKFFAEAEKHQTEVDQIIKQLHGHTFAVELAARLLTKGTLTPQALVEKLQTERAALDAAEKIRTNKDGQNIKATYYEQIHNLFSLWLLYEEEQEILRCMTLVPIKGIPTRTFAAWMQQKDMNTINDLVEIGLINPKNSQEILLHPMIREIVVEELDSSVSRCSVLLDSLREISNRQGYDYVNNKILFHTVESIIGTIEIDDAAHYLLFLETVFQYMDKYQYISGMKLVITEMSQILSADSIGTINDRVCLLDCRAALEQNAKKRIGLLEEGLRMLGEIHAGNAHLAANLHNNVGVMYHQSGQMDEARAHLEQAIRLMDNYGLNDYQDRVAQTCSYASILTDQGSAWRAYMMMQKIAREVREHNSDHCIDYALIQETMGGISVIKGDPNQADLHYRTAMAIYEVVYENEPVLLEEKRREIGRAKMSFRHGPLIDTT